VVGDEVYGVPGARLMLHAERLAFPHPATGERIVCVAEIPASLRNSSS
jgi:23S rRNA-/tRNA-specific pseudouridylate synthase